MTDSDNREVHINPSFTLVYTSEQDPGVLAALELICDLSEASQTKEIFWVNPDQENASEGRPPVKAFLINKGLKVPVDLYAKISAFGALERVDLFTCCSFLTNSAIQESLGNEALKLVTYLKGLVPGNTTVHEKRIFFPKYGYLAPEGKFFPEMGSTNLVVIPEDREIPNSVPFALDNPNKRFSWHIADEIISHAGLWITMKDHLLVDSDESTGGNTRVQLSRSFVRSAISTTETPDELLNLKTNLPKPKGFDPVPNYLKAIRTVADDAHPEDFKTIELEPFDPITRVEGRAIILHVLHRVISDLKELPRTLRNGFHSHIDQIVNKTASELVGEYSWVRPLWEEIDNDSQASEADPESLDSKELLALLNAGTELDSPAANAAAWEDLKDRTLGSIDGSGQNYFAEDQKVIVNRSALTPEITEEDLGSVLIPLGVDPEELHPSLRLSKQPDENTEPESAEPENTELENTDLDTSVTQENLLTLIGDNFTSERDRIENRFETLRSKLQNIEKPTSQDRSKASRYIRWFFVGSVVIAFLALTTLVGPIRRSLDFSFLSSSARTQLLLFATALTAIPTILIFTPNNKEKTGPFLISSFSGLAGLTAFFAFNNDLLIPDENPKVGLFGWLFSLWDHWTAWLIPLLIIAALCFFLWKGIKQTGANSLSKIGKKILYVMGPAYLLLAYIFSFSHGSGGENVVYLWTWIEKIVAREGTLLVVSLTISVVAFLTSALLLSIYKMQDENYLNVYREESKWLIHHMEDASKHYKTADLLRTHWFGTAAVLHRLLKHPFGNLSNLQIRTAFRPVSSDEFLKMKTIDLELTEVGKQEFKNSAIPSLTPPGWILRQYRLASDAFLLDDELNFSDRTSSCQCFFPFYSLEDATDLEEISGKGTRWPLCDCFFTGTLDSVLRDSANKTLTDTLLSIYMGVENSWKAQDGSGKTIPLQEEYSRIAPQEGDSEHFAMGMFGNAAGLLQSSTEMSTSYVWPDEEIVTLPQEAQIPTAKAPHQRIGNSIIFQAVRLDISGPINLEEMRPPPTLSGGDIRPEENDRDDGSDLF